MTREQAIREIDDIDYYLQHHTDDYSESSHTAMMMAISALEQEPCDDLEREYEKTKALFSKIVKDDDAISREHLLSEIEKLKQSPWFNENINGARIVRREAINMVEDLCIRQEPPVQSSRKGHWEIEELFAEGRSIGAIICCSECGNNMRISPSRYENLNNTERFCSKCGADMR